MLTVDEIAKLAPAAMARKPAPHCSPRFSFLPTMEAVDALRKEGYVPVEARQDHASDDGWGRHKHCKHLIVMRMKGTETMDRKAMGGLIPELRMYNASDATTPFSLKRGMLRQVCTNGLVIMTEQALMRTVHKNVTAEDVIAQARALAANTKPMFDKIQKWTKIRLDPTAQKRFAAQALLLRLGGIEQRAKRYDVMSMIAVRRPEDEAPTLWNLFNRAQENGMRGGVAAREDAGRGVGMRTLTGLNAELQFNQEMWKLAEKWAAYVK